jgi:hypothetical protein
MMGAGIYDLGNSMTFQGPSVYTNPLFVEFDLSGKPIWAGSQSGGDGSFHFTAGAMHAAHRYLAGYFEAGPSGNEFDFGMWVVAKSGREFLMSFNRLGSAEWIEMPPAPGRSVWSISCIAVDRAGYLVVAGDNTLQKALDFGHGVSLDPAERAFIAKYKISLDR